MSMKKFTHVMVILLILSLGSSIAMAENASTGLMSTRVTFADEVKAIAVQGDYGYVLHGHIMSVLDVSNPVEPKVLGSVEATGNALVVEKDYVYLISGHTLRVVNVSDPFNPVLVSSKGIRYDQSSIDYYDGYVYIGSGWGLSIVDVSDPYAPQEISYFDRNLGIVNQVVVAPDPTGQSDNVYAYLSTVANPRPGGGLIIVDVSDPANPKHANPHCNDYCGNGRGLSDLVLQGVYVFASNSWEPQYYGLEVRDISDPAHPDFITRYSTPDTPLYNVALQGEQIYTAGLEKNNDDREVLITFDVANKSELLQAGWQLTAHNQGYGDMFATDNCLYIPQGEAGLEILCQSNVTPTPPKVTFLPLFSWLGE